jgi:hypothetical protein
MPTTLQYKIQRPDSLDWMPWTSTISNRYCTCSPSFFPLFVWHVYTTVLRYFSPALNAIHELNFYVTLYAHLQSPHTKIEFYRY